MTTEESGVVKQLYKLFQCTCLVKQCPRGRAQQMGTIIKADPKRFNDKFECELFSSSVKNLQPL